MALFQWGPNRYEPDPEIIQSHFTFHQRRLALFVGLIALLLPVALYSSGSWGVCGYRSISHYYYSRLMGGVFVGSLSVLGAFLLAYRGETIQENRLASLAGVAALILAFFPTSDPYCEDEVFIGRPFAQISPSELEGFTLSLPPNAPASFFDMFVWSEEVHYFSAAFLFGFLAWYSIFVFTRPSKASEDTSGVATWQKKSRNVLYYASGAIILSSLLAIAMNSVFGGKAGLPGWHENRVTFWLETSALWAFGLSWMVKGRFFFGVLADPAERRRFRRSQPGYGRN
ncbi:MAG: hypothetical protein AAGI03_08540 [Pseudomonadota bacterium]